MKAPGWADTGSDEEDSLWAMPSAYKSDQDTIIADWAVEAHAGKGNPAETLLCPAQWAGRLTWPATLHAITSNIARGRRPPPAPGERRPQQGHGAPATAQKGEEKSCQRK